jgi:hypothetical protein
MAAASRSATMTVSELETLALTQCASDNLDIVVKTGKHNRDVFQRMCDAFGWVFIAYDGLKRTLHAVRAGGFDDGWHSNRS